MKESEIEWFRPLWLRVLVTVLVGIAAALLGGVLADWLGVGDTAGIDWIRHIIQVALAVLGVWLVTRFTGRRTGTPHAAR